MTIHPVKHEPEPPTFLSFFQGSVQAAALSALFTDAWTYDKRAMRQPEEDHDLSNYIASSHVPEVRQFPKKKRRRNDAELTELQNFLLKIRPADVRKPRMSKIAGAYVSLPRYDKWKHVGHGYLVVPDLPPLKGPATWTDFLFQGFLKALATGGEGNSSGFVRDEQAPLLAASARLEHSMNVDEHGIENLKLEAKMARGGSDQKTSIEHLAKLRNALMHKLWDYADDRAPIYRPPVEILEEHPEQAIFHAFKMDEFHFLTYMVRMIELTSRLMPRHLMVISKALQCFIPLLLEGPRTKDCDVHFVGTRVHLSYFHHLFCLLERLSSYFNEIQNLPIRATFGALKTVRSDVSCVVAKELAKIAENVDYGGSISWMLCVVRDVSIAVTLSPSSQATVPRAVELLRSGKATSRDLVRIAFAVDKGKPLYKFRFVVDSQQRLTFRASKVTHEEMADAASVASLAPHPISPFYPLLVTIGSPIHVDPSESAPVACIPESSEFLFDANTNAKTESSERSLRLEFLPGSRASTFSFH